MTDNSSAIDNRKILLIAIIFAVALFLIFRSFGLYSLVMDDEYAYSKFSRLLPLSKAVFPDYLFYIAYRTTNVCGDGFLNCARIINIAFFVSAAPFIYCIGSKIVGRNTALLVSALSILAPISIYTAFFMPESMYFFSFWAFTWFFFRTARHQSVRQWALLGVIYGATALIKPHAIFLLPAYACLCIIFFRQNENGNFVRKLAPYAAFLAAAIAIKFLVGYLLAGKSGLTVFGPIYTHNASGSIAEPSHFSGLTRLALENLWGHILALLLLYSVPVAQTLLAVKYFYQKPPGQSLSINLKLYAAVVLAVLLVAVALFTAAVAGTGAFETNTRLHMRYYDFAFPLLLLVAASQLAADSPVANLKWRAVTAFPVGAVILYAIYTKIAPYTPNFVDAPDLQSFMLDPRVFYFMGGLSMLSLLAWTFKPRLGTQIFVYVFLPLSVLSSTLFVSHELAKRHAPDDYDKAGIFTRQYLDDDKLLDILVVGSDMTGMYRTMFALDNPAASIRTIAEIDAMGNSELAKKKLAEKRWILLFGNHRLPEDADLKLPMNGYTLIKVPGYYLVDFKKSSWPGVVTKASGLYPNEFWGTWSIGDVTLEFAKPLPERFAVHLWGFTYGPFLGKPFVAHVGKNSQSFTLGPAATEERLIEFDNPERANTITFDIPSTTSPMSAGLGNDDRILGIAFTRINIVPLSVKW